ncbi:MAG TPA: 8-amino-7-oxononanoate synthase [Candidatus Corynebacterium gallistercoris]|uniref:8-amino-7-oxononanoate synthase n=1 Tax=Candidatus Corynebacterium gallistercoris TaxID=2838530 RepID=A0A9D1UQX5_9CORY|nr:8-amino-7-oxononanoate synthase [Candidatus Corynebacterium gallistercoris]
MSSTHLPQVTPHPNTSPSHTANHPNTWPTHIANRLTTWSTQGLERHMRTFTTGQTPHARIDNHARLLFSSSNYLGLAEHPAITTAAREALERYGVGSGGSRLTTGNTHEHDLLERELAQWLRYPAACFFATGYQANVGTIATLADAQTVIFSDQRNHASIIDGCRLAKATHGTHTIVYPHRDTAALARLMDTTRAELPDHRFLLISDGVFSMDGTIAPLPTLLEVATRYGALTIIDDAHGIGTLGTGRGIIDLGNSRPDVLIGTASKALGAEGGFVCASADIVRLLRNQARSFVFSTSNSPAIAAAVRTAVGIVSLGGDATPTHQLHHNATVLRTQLAAAGLGAVVVDEASVTPIIPVHIGAEDKAMAVAAELQARGFHVPAIRYPTVPRGAAILRVTVMATHTEEQITRFVEVLQEVMEAVTEAGESTPPLQP